MLPHNTPAKRMFSFRGMLVIPPQNKSILESACLSIHLSLCVSVCIQNISFCQSAGGGIKSHLVTGLVSPETN